VKRVRAVAFGLAYVALYAGMWADQIAGLPAVLFWVSVPFASLYLASMTTDAMMRYLETRKTRSTQPIGAEWE